MKRWMKWCGILGIAAVAMGVAAHAGSAELYVYFQNGRILRVTNTYTDGPWIFLVLDAQNQFAVPEESVKRIERVPMIEGEPVAATGANVGVQAAPSVGGKSPHSPPARDAYRASPGAPGSAAQSAATTRQQNNSQIDPERQKKLERLREERRKNAPNQGRRRGQRGGSRAGSRPNPNMEPSSKTLP
ncbi:MAG: hypothetical protein JSV08_06765 [Acidobacteriota bacterium]|nr:MAG: hypothetical protein JSV08_06765 [Acidobacteriota bacterium]